MVALMVLIKEIVLYFGIKLSIIYEKVKVLAKEKLLTNWLILMVNLKEFMICLKKHIIS